MTVLMFQKRFIAPVLAGTKRQTIRPRRKRPIPVGAALSLRHWFDKPYRSPQVEFFATECAGYIDVTIRKAGVQLGTGDFVSLKPRLDEFALADGFSCWLEMREFFMSRFGYGLPFAGTLIIFV